MSIKKKVIILIIILIIIALGIGIYFWLQAKKKEIPPLEEKSVEKLTEEKTQFIKVVSENSIRFYNPETSLFEELDISSGQATAISSKPMYLIIDVLWSPSGSKAILRVENNRAIHSQDGLFLDESVSDGEITIWSLNFENEELTQLSQDITGIDWISDEEIIYSLAREQSKDSLFQSDWRGQNNRKIIDLDDDKIFNASLFLSPDKKNLILYSEIEGLGNNSFFIFNLNNKNFIQVTEEGLTPSAVWSTKGDYLLFYRIDKNSLEPYLWLANNKGVEKRSLNIVSPFGLAITDENDKYLYAVVPEEYKIDEETGERLGNDNLYQINSGSLEKKVILEAEKTQGISKIDELGLLGNDLYILSQESLYKIKL